MLICLYTLVFFSCCFHEGLAHVEYLADLKQQNIAPKISQTGHEIHQSSLLLRLHTDFVTVKQNEYKNYCTMHIASYRYYQHTIVLLLLVELLASLSLGTPECDNCSINWSLFC